MKTLFSFVTLFSLFILLQACGGGGDGSTLPRAQKTATVEFATSSTDANVKLRGVFIVATLPAGVTVATIPGTTEISSAALKGVANSGQLFFGTYSAAIRKVRIPVTSVPGTDMAIGPFASLICDIVPGNTLNESQFSSIVPLEFEATGPNGFDLTKVNPPVVPKISVTFGY